jgi:drug/metabolite transporter (DMT)-like permease
MDDVGKAVPDQEEAPTGGSSAGSLSPAVPPSSTAPRADGVDQEPNPTGSPIPAEAAEAVGAVAASEAPELAEAAEAPEAEPSISLLTGLAIAFTVVCWASAFVGIRDAVQYFSAGPLAFFRYVVASVVLGGVLLAQRMPLPERRDWLRLAWVGLAGITLYNLLLNYGSEFIKAGSASFLVNTAPIFTAIFASFMLRERVTALRYGGIVLGFIGAILIFFGEGEDVAVEPAALLILLAAVVFALFFILQKPLLQSYSPLQVIAMAVWIGTLLMIPASLEVVSEFREAPADAKAVVVYLGVFPGALAYAAWSYVLSKIPANKAASFIYCVGPTTVLIAWLWLDEVPTVLSLVGGAVALTGVVIVNTLGQSRSRRPG